MQSPLEGGTSHRDDATGAFSDNSSRKSSPDSVHDYSWNYDNDVNDVVANNLSYGHCADNNNGYDPLTVV